MGFFLLFSLLVTLQAACALSADVCFGVGCGRMAGFWEGNRQ